MARLMIKSNPVNTIGDLPAQGRKAPDFSLTKTDLSDMTLKDLAGKRVIMNIFPSIDTPVCSMSVRQFNQRAGSLEKTTVLSISLDLPFAHGRFCETEGIDNVIPLSELRDRHFGNDYGVRMIDGPLAGLLARAVLVLDESGTVIYSQLVEELTQEPNYEEVIEVLKKHGEENASIDGCTKSFTAEHDRGMDMDDPCDDGRGG